MATRTNMQTGDVSARSAHPSRMTNNSTNTSPGLIQLGEPVDGDMPQEEDGDVNVQIGENSYVGDVRMVADGSRIRAIDLYDSAHVGAHTREGAHVGAVGKT
ncbi:hypothetical protein EIK77_000184 [Talaromyces pinophilus]|nr:hypothetical protein EIK77_000184 [Talaromyces pinophilus]